MIISVIIQVFKRTSSNIVKCKIVRIIAAFLLFNLDFISFLFIFFLIFK